MRGAASRVDWLAGAIDAEGDRDARVEQRRLLDVLEARHGPAVDGLDDIAGLEAGVGGRRSGLNEADARQVFGAPEADEQPRENDDGKNEIGGRPGRDDRRPIEQRLAGERAGALLRGQGRDRGGINRARRIGVAEKFDVSAKRE